jgi:UDP-2-acetamido-2,6-beta-L-arabino-hexul-4-ose reductase
VSAYVYRLTNVFGKWCRPNYNSVVATFCHNIAHGLEIAISDPARELQLVHIDAVIDDFLGFLSRPRDVPPGEYLAVEPIYRISLGELAQRIRQFRDIRTSLRIPDLSDDLTRLLYSTYLTYLDPKDFAYGLDTKSDARGRLVELFKSRPFGQIFMSKTYGGVVRGNHYHDTKTEKFCVIQGEGIISFRNILTNETVSYPVTGDEIKIVDIPPGYTHSIRNASDREMIVLFWASQIFDSEKPDTYSCEV